MKTYKGTRCFCEWQPFLDPDTNTCSACGATLQEVARHEAETAKWIEKNCRVKCKHLELVPKDHVELY
jgi:hypothetical protein